MNADINNNQRLENYKKSYQVRIVKKTKEIADKLAIEYPELNLSDIDSQPSEDAEFLAIHDKVLDHINSNLLTVK